MNSGLLLVLIMHSHARPAILRKINCSNRFEKKEKKKQESKKIQWTVFSMLKSIFEFCVLLTKIRILKSEFKFKFRFPNRMNPN